MSLILGLFAGAAQAKSAFGVMEYPPQPVTAAYQDQFVDMQVMALGGYVAVQRSWMGSGWMWNRQLRNIELLNAALEPWSYTDAASISQLAFIRRGTENYIRLGGSSPVMFFNTHVRSIEVDMSGASPQLIWRNRNGDVIYYDVTGRVKSSTDRNGVRVNWVHDGNGKLSEVTDHFNNTLLTYEYTGNNLSKITDYSGRILRYTYVTGTQLIETVTLEKAHQNEAGGLVDETLTYTYSGTSLTGYTDALGRSTELAIDAYGRLTKRVNEDGVGSSFAFSYNRQTELYTTIETDGEGVVTEYRYNILGDEVYRSINGEVVKTVDVTLSDNGKTLSRYINMFKMTANAASNFDMGLYAKYKTVVDAMGETSYIELDQWGNVTKITHGDGTFREARYNQQYNVPAWVKNENGIITTFEYDSKGNLLKLKEGIASDGGSWQRISCYDYNSYGLTTSKKIQEGNASDCSGVLGWQYEYDVDVNGYGYGNNVSITDAASNLNHYSAYDALGYAHTQIDQHNITWQRSVDNSGNKVMNWNIAGVGTKKIFDASGQVVKTFITDGSTHVGEITYVNNQDGYPKTSMDAAGKQAQVAYDKKNRLVQTADAGTLPGIVNTMTIEYNALGQPVRTVDGELNQTFYHYTNNLLTQIEHPTYKQNSTYDVRGRISTTTTVDGGNITLSSESYSYDHLGNLSTITDSANNVTRHEYDALNRRVKTYLPANGYVQYIYDVRNNLVQVIDPENRSTHYSYNDLNQLTDEYKDSQYSSGPSGAHRHYVYDDSGNLKEVHSPAGEKQVYYYTSHGLLDYVAYFKKISGSDVLVHTVDHQYDSYHRYAGYLDDYVDNTFSGDGASLHYNYDDAGDKLNRIMQVDVNFGAGTGIAPKSYGYSYYPNGLKQGYTPPMDNNAAGQHINRHYGYQYNRNNQMTSLKITNNNGAEEGSINYSNNRWLALQDVQFPGNTWLKRNVDDLLRIKEWGMHINNASGALASANYEYNDRANLTKIVRDDGVYDFSYDELNRLTSWSRDAVGASATPWDINEGFTYDKVSNRQTQEGNGLRPGEVASATDTYSYNPDNQLEAVLGSVSFTYDANGNTTRKNITGLGTYVYSYNESQRLSKVQFDAQGDGSTPDVTEGEYTYDAVGLRRSKTANGSTIFFLYTDQGLANEYNSSGNLIKEYHYQAYTQWTTNPLLQTSDGTAFYYYQNNHLGAPERMFNKAGAVVWQADYQAFGWADIELASVENNLRLPGQYYDSESQLYQNFHRDYDPTLGRYLQHDPIGLNGGLNVYAYVGGNPIASTDARGLANDNTPLNSLNCEALQKLIDYEKEHGKWDTLNKYNSLSFSDDMVNLDGAYPTTGGLVSADWMLRSAGPGGATSAPGLSAVTYGVTKVIWNSISGSAPWANITGEANSNAGSALSNWYYGDKTLEQIFGPALKQCACIKK